MNGAEALRYARSRHTLERLRPRRPPAARPAVAARAGRPAGRSSRGCRSSSRRSRRAVQTDIPVDQLDELLGLASQVDTTNIRSYVFAPPLYGRRRCRARAATSSCPNVEQDPGRGQGRVHGQPGRRGAAPEARRGGRRGLGPQRHRRPRPGARPRRLPRVPRPGRLGAAPEARRCASRPTRRSSSTTAPRRSSPTPSPTSRRRSGSTVDDRDRPAIRADIVVTIGRTTPNLDGAARRPDAAGPPPDRARPTRSASASGCTRAAGRGPRRSSGRGRAGRSGRSRRTRPAGGRPR